MTRDERALREDFLQCCKARSVFTPAKHVKAAIQRRRGIGNDTLARLRDGSAVFVDVIDALVDLGLEGTEQGGAAVHGALRDYCIPRGVSVDRRNARGIVALISQSAEPSHRDPALADEDFVEHVCRRATESGMDELRRDVRPAFEVGGLELVRAAVEWIYIEYGRQHSRSQLHRDAAIKIGTHHVGLPLAAYQLSAASWATKVPWTVAVTLEGTEPIGATISLPLNESAYLALREGKLDSCRLPASELRFPSNRLFIEAIAMKPHAGVAGARTPAERLYLGLLAQCARLTRVAGIGEELALYVLSCAFAPVSAKRVRPLKFQPTGTCLANTHLPLLERVVDITKQPTDASFWGNWRTLQAQLRDSD